MILLCGCSATEPHTNANISDGTTDFLYMVADEETLEKRIASYFKHTYEVEAEYGFFEEDDLYLRYLFSSEDAEFPPISVVIDSLVSSTDEDTGSATERRISLRAAYVMPEATKTVKNRQIILEQINQWHEGRWVPQRIYIDSDGDLILESTINIPGDGYPLHAEIVSDQIIRMYYAWQEFYGELSETLTVTETSLIAKQMAQAH